MTLGDVENFFTLQHTATYCSTLRHIATHCDTLQLYEVTRCNYILLSTATLASHQSKEGLLILTVMWKISRHCNTLQHTAAHCGILQRTATRCNTLQHTATYCSTLQHIATHCDTLQLYEVTRCNYILLSTAPFASQQLKKDLSRLMVTWKIS